MSIGKFSDNFKKGKVRMSLSREGHRLLDNLDKDLNADKQMIERRLNKFGGRR